MNSSLPRLLLIAAGLLSGGCTLTKFMTHNVLSLPTQCLEDRHEDRRNHKMARAAWLDCQNHTPFARHGSDFGDGFVAGYCDYLKHGDPAEPPPLPPKKYWKVKYQTPAGANAMQEWFTGFRAGVDTARQSGVRQLVTLPYSAVDERMATMAAPIIETGPPPTPNAPAPKGTEPQAPGPRPVAPKPDSPKPDSPRPLLKGPTTGPEKTIVQAEKIQPVQPKAQPKLQPKPASNHRDLDLATPVSKVDKKGPMGPADKTPPSSDLRPSVELRMLEKDLPPLKFDQPAPSKGPAAKTTPPPSQEPTQWLPPLQVGPEPKLPPRLAPELPPRVGPEPKVLPRVGPAPFPLMLPATQDYQVPRPGDPANRANLGLPSTPAP